MDIKIVRKIAAAFVILVLLTIVFSIFYLVSYLVTAVGALLLFVIFVHSLARFLIRVVVFPGSNWYFRRTIEKNFANITAHQLQHRLFELNSFLHLSPNRSKSHINLPMIIETISNIAFTLQSLEIRMQTTPGQKKLLQNLLELTEYLNTLTVNYFEKKVPLLDWCRDQPCPIEEITLDPLLANPKALDELEVILKKPSELFGFLDYMRVDLMNRFDCEQVWLEMNDHTKIDW